jgi:hypothetical protein
MAGDRRVTARKIDIQVQAMYDALTDEERRAFDERLIRANRRLCDMRIAKSTGKLDERLLIPRDGKRVANFDHKRTIRQKHENGEPLTEREIQSTFGGEDKTIIRPAEGSLKEGQDVAAYIRERLADGKALADFYINILTISHRDSRKQGVFVNHKLQAAAWLADRGWGKAKGDESEKGVTINLVNHADMNVPDRPALPATLIETRRDEDNDAGRDVDVTIVPTDATKGEPQDIDVEFDENLLR